MTNKTEKQGTQGYNKKEAKYLASFLLMYLNKIIFSYQQN